MPELLAREVSIPAGGVALEGSVTAPGDATGLVVFAHGSGSSRFSPRNTQVAEELHRHRLATVLFDLLTEHEDSSYANRFDIELLSSRLQAAIGWAKADPELSELPLGLFGASTGAAAALVAAARMRGSVDAVVSRGGRPDLAMRSLPDVTAPTLLIVGGYDDTVLGLNEIALDQLTGEKQLVIVPKATHLFEEPGALEEVAALAADWFETNLRR